MTDLTALRELIPMLEKAEGADRELDAKIVAAFNHATLRAYPATDDFGPKGRWQFWSADGKHFLGNEGRFHVPPYTASLDVCALLQEECLPGHFLRVEQRNDGSFDTALSPINDAFTFRLHADERLSRLLAIVHAYIAQEEGK